MKPVLAAARAALMLLGLTSCADDTQDVEDKCAQILCGDHGTCVAEAGVSCECDPGYMGMTCEECAEGYSAAGEQCLLDTTDEASCAADDPCGEQGTCREEGGELSCECAEGYDGETCEDCAAGFHVSDERSPTDAALCIADVECRVTSCNHAGTCDDSSGAPVCECEDGYEGEHCDACDTGFHEDGQSCEEDQHCEEDSCPTHATCDDAEGVIACSCDTGYTGTDCDECLDDLVMNDDGECTLPLPPCESGSVRNAAGDCEQPPVECDSDEELSELPDGGSACVPLAATCLTDNPCTSHGSCDDSDAELVCVCDEGWVGAICDECAPDYVRDGQSCVLGLQCTAETCSGHGACDVLDNELICSCVDGYTGGHCEDCDVGYWATTEGECEPGESCEEETCSVNALCAVVQGLTTCNCFEGYTGDDCIDCAAGYHPSGDRCSPDRSCLSTTCSGVGTCDDASDEIVCSCEEGNAGTHCEVCAEDYTRADGVCVPLELPNQCTATLCNHGTCDDATGQAVCTCDVHYKGLYCQGCSTGYVLHPDGVCRPTACGDGIIDSVAGETCDDGNTVTEECPYSMNLASCAICTSACLAAPGAANYCGDGNLDTGETCDDGAQNGSYSAPPGLGVCKLDCSGLGPYCGDGIAEDYDGGPEDCDDGNQDGGCSNLCAEPDGCFTYNWSGSIVVADWPAAGAQTIFNVTEDAIVEDVNLTLSVNHSYISDLVVVLGHGPTSVTLSAQSENYCDANNWVGVVLDDEGQTDIDTSCTDNLTSPPNYTPLNPLSAFDAVSSLGDWTLTVSDSVSLETGTLLSASLRVCPVPDSGSGGAGGSGGTGGTGGSGGTAGTGGTGGAGGSGNTSL